MTANTQEHVSQNSAFLVIFGGLLSMLGIIAIASPLTMGIAVDLFVGLMVLSRGAMQLYYGFKVRHWGNRFGSYIGVGSIAVALMSVAVGVLLLVNPIAGLRFLTLVLAGYLIVSGGFEVIHSIELADAKGWFFILLSGLLGIALGIMIWLQWPVSGRLALGLMVGFSFFVSGGSLIMLGLAGREGLEARLPPEVNVGVEHL